MYCDSNLSGLFSKSFKKKLRSLSLSKQLSAMAKKSKKKAKEAKNAAAIQAQQAQANTDALIASDAARLQAFLPPSALPSNAPLSFTAPPPTSSGAAAADNTWLYVGAGVLALGAFFLLRKKKS